MPLSDRVSSVSLRLYRGLYRGDNRHVLELEKEDQGGLRHTDRQCASGLRGWIDYVSASGSAIPIHLLQDDIHSVSCWVLEPNLPWTGRPRA